ncbi:MAG: lipid-A-disaccharide synthase [Proteobacteria bacterium]|nr:lipid-A-disaccharide synthase [Pseudomonadota bacterium]NBX86019.1 lipid-A-disaccharide synthase [Pseudomonadota bacterium]
MKILITALEPSGDRLAAGLMRELRAKMQRQKPAKKLEFYGVGGPAMRAEGLHMLQPMEQLAAMGLVEVLPIIPRIWACLRRLVAWVEMEKPALVVCVDGQDFSARLAARLRKLAKPTPCVLYAAPKVWAWRPKRAAKLRELYDAVLCLLPFEVDFLADFGVSAEYVGHPAVALAAGSVQDIQLELALLPGSRGAELRRHWPLMLATLRRLCQLVPQLRGLLVLPDEAALAVCRNLADFSAEDGIEVVVGEGRFAALARCRAALAKSGTNTLELALLGVPAVVCYRLHGLSYWLAKRLVTLPLFSLPNLVLNPQILRGGAVGEVVYPEYIQAAATPENLGRALYPLLVTDKARGRQLKLLAKVRQAMEHVGGKPIGSPAEKAAAACIKILARGPNRPA